MGFTITTINVVLLFYGTVGPTVLRYLMLFLFAIYLRSMYTITLDISELIYMKYVIPIYLFRIIILLD